MIKISVVYKDCGNFSLDKKIEKIVGKRCSGAGTFLPTMERDLSFTLKKPLHHMKIKNLKRIHARVVHES